jgi:hypothetical protein
MRMLFILAFVANVALTMISIAMLPDRVAIHFGGDGTADGWAPNDMNALFMTGMHILLFCVFYFSPRLMFLFPVKWISLPNKGYWLQPSVVPRTKARISRFMWQFGVAMFLLLLVIGILAFQANMASTVRLNLTVFFTALGGFMLYTIAWTIAFLRAFRLPPDQQG